MKNYVQVGDTVTLHVPDQTDGISSGDGLVVGSIFGVAVTDVEPDSDGEFKTTGVFDLPKTTGEAWTQGQRIYWVAATGKCTTTAGSNKLIGTALEIEESADTIGRVRLSGAFTL